MFHSYAIIHPDEQTRQALLDKYLARHPLHPVDLWQTSANPITIELIRDLKIFLSRSPYASPFKAAVLDASLLSLEAQQALLKTLEEPPSASFIYLLARHEDTLLPTIKSRCLIIKGEVSDTPRPDDLTRADQFWKPVLAGRGGERLKLTENIPPDRKKLVSWLDQQILFFRSVLVIQVIGGKAYFPLTSRQLFMIIKLLQIAQRQAKENLTLRLVLDHLILNLPQIQNN